MKPRLLILSNGIHPDRTSGTPYWCSLVARALQAQWNVTVLAPSDGGPAAPCAPVERTISGVRVLTWRETDRARNDYIGDYFSPELDAALGAVVQREQPDSVLVLNFGGLSATIAPVCIENKIPLHFFVNDVSPFCFNGYFNRPMQQRCDDSRAGKDCGECLQRRRHEPEQAKIDALRRWGQALVRSFAGVAAPTGWFCERLMHETNDAEGRNRYRVIRYGLPAILPRRGRIFGSVRTLAFFGGGRPRKGGEILIDALLRVRSTRADLPFVVRWFGEGTCAIPPALRAQIELRGLLSTDALLEEFESIDCSLFPSLGEVFPLTILQSLQRRVPIIATDLGGYREILTDSADALLVDQGAEPFARAIMAVLDGRTRLSVRYSVPSIETAATAIDRMLREPHPPRVTAAELTARAREVSHHLASREVRAPSS